MSGKPPNRKAGSGAKPSKPCPNAINVYTGRPDVINNNNGKEQVNPLRSRLSAVLSQPKINLDAEVDRLVGAARVYAEKEKFKLKQFYEEEIKKTKKTVIQEFKCAMEREIIGPLKTKLCSYEKEIYNLKQELETACKQQEQVGQGEEGTVVPKSDNTEKEKELLHHELDRAHKERKSLFTVIHGENLRKSIRASSIRGSLFVSEEGFLSKEGYAPEDEQDDEELTTTETLETVTTTETSGELQAQVQGQPRPKSGTSGVVSKAKSGPQGRSMTAGPTRKVSGGGEAQAEEGGGVEEATILEETEEEGRASAALVLDENGEPLGETEVNLASSPAPTAVSFTEPKHKLSRVPRNTADDLKERLHNTALAVGLSHPDEISEDTQKLLIKIQDLTVSLAQSRQFTEEEIADLIKETELVEELRRRIAELEAENDALRKKIEDQLAQMEMMKPPRGSIEDANYQLRNQLKELEEEMARMRAALEAERDKYKTDAEILQKQLEELRLELETTQDQFIPIVEDDEIPVVEEETTRPKTPSVQSARSKEPSIKSVSAKKSDPASVKSSEARRSSRGGSIIPRSPEKSIVSELVEETEPEPEGPPPKCTVEHPERCSIVEQIEAEYQREMEELRQKLNKTQEDLLAIAQLEARIKELEQETAEMEALRKRIAELSAELLELQNKEPPECPRPSETEKLELQRKLGDLEAISQKRMEDFESLQKRAAELEARNVDLAQSVAQLQVANEKASNLEQMHSQMLEEKRRKSAECNNLALKMREVEAQKSALQKELNEKTTLLENLMKELEKLRQENAQMLDELTKLREKVQKSSEGETALRSELQNKTQLLSQLQANIDSLMSENERLKREVDTLRKQLNDATVSRSNLEAELAHLRRQMADIELQYKVDLDAIQRKCAEECGELSRKGQCILEHEKKCLALTDQLADDNVQLQERIRQLEQQLEEFYSMEKRTKQLQLDMNSLQLRAAERTKELQNLKNMPEACSLDFPPSSAYTAGPPIGRALSPWPPARESGAAGVGKKKNSTQCRLLSAQLADLDAEKRKLSKELEGKQGEVNAVNRRLAGIEEENRKVRGMVNDVCADAAVESIIVINERQGTSPTTPTVAVPPQISPYQSNRGIDLDETQSNSSRLGVPARTKTENIMSSDEEDAKSQSGRLAPPARIITENIMSSEEDDEYFTGTS